MPDRRGKDSAADGGFRARIPRTVTVDFTVRSGGLGSWAVCEDLIATPFGAKYTRDMAPRTLILSVFLAAIAAVVPALLADPDVHAAEAWRAIPAQIETVQVEAVQVETAEAQTVQVETMPAETVQVETMPASASAPIAAEAPTADQPVAAEPIVAEPVVADAVTDEPTEEQPVASEVVAESVVAEEPTTTIVVAAAAPASETPATPADDLFAPVAVAGYSIGDLSAQAQGAQAATLQTGDSADLFPAEFDGDLNGDMVEILIPSVGQGALFPAEFDGDLNGDMVAIVIPDGAPFPAAG